jgi:hypothetical protein
MRDRLPLMLSATALVVSVLGVTPLGEAAYNAVVPNNSVGADQLRNAAVTNAKLRGDAVTSGKVLNGSLRLVDFKANQIPAGPSGPKGDKGDKGTKGDKGSKGDKGEPGVSGYLIVQGPNAPLPANGTGSGTATCPAGKRALGGGGHHFSGSGFVAYMVQSLPDQNGNGAVWRATFKNPTSTPATMYAFAVCATVAP